MQNAEYQQNKNLFEFLSSTFSYLLDLVTNRLMIW